MRRSLVVLSLCAALASITATQSVLASESTATQTAEIKPTIAQGDASAVGAASAVCSGCHGADGVSTIPENPSLAGQGAPYLYKQLIEFKSGARENAVMSGMVAALDDDTMRNLAAFYAEMAPPSTLKSSPDNLEAGRQIYLGGITSIQVLESFRSGARANDPGKMMQMVARRMSDEEIAAVANYVQGLH